MLSRVRYRRPQNIQYKFTLEPDSVSYWKIFLLSLHSTSTKCAYSAGPILTHTHTHIYYRSNNTAVMCVGLVLSRLIVFHGTLETCMQPLIWSHWKLARCAVLVIFIPFPPPLNIFPNRPECRWICL